MRQFLKSLACAFAGIYASFRSERNFRIHIVLAFLALALGAYLGLSVAEWGLIIISIGFVMTAELFNTALERLGDEAAAGKQNGRVGKAKDISAAAVLLSALTALVIGILILIVPLVRRIIGLL